MAARLVNRKRAIRIGARHARAFTTAPRTFGVQARRSPCELTRMASTPNPRGLFGQPVVRDAKDPETARVARLALRLARAEGAPLA